MLIHAYVLVFVKDLFFFFCLKKMYLFFYMTDNLINVLTARHMALFVSFIMQRSNKLLTVRHVAKQSGPVLLLLITLLRVAAS